MPAAVLSGRVWRSPANLMAGGSGDHLPLADFPGDPRVNKQFAIENGHLYWN